MNTNSNNQAENLAKPVLANRLFKFRAWEKEQNRMFKVFGFNEHLVFEQTWDSPSIKENIFEIEDCHIMQFTGFKDFDGKEIYEGDILEYVSFRRDENKRREIVEFDEKCGGWYVHKQADALCNVLFEQHDEEWQLKQNYKPSIKHKVRVIGNIYENPELTQTTS